MYTFLNMENVPCTVCREPGHSPSHCPTLSQPLVPGFYSPPGGVQPDNEDE
jgi:hypothetical protein